MIKQKLKKDAPKDWTPEEDSLLLERAKAGDTMAKISKAINEKFNSFRTRLSVGGRLFRLKQSSNKIKTDMIKKKKVPNKPPTQKTNHSAPLPMEEPEPQNLISLLDLKPDSCRWPYGDKTPYKFCGQKRCGSGPYCRTHEIKSDAKSSKR